MVAVEFRAQDYDDEAVRSAVYSAIPDSCRDEEGFACVEALERTFLMGRTATLRRMSPEEAIDMVWGSSLGACCKQMVTLEPVPVQITPAHERALVSV
jgi:hypothetical protein